MSCDIHLHIEVKVKGAKGWQHYGEPRIRWGYALFAKMADVRNYKGSGIVPIAKPKGLPIGGVSIITEHSFRQWDCDAHSTSWLQGDEIVALDNWLQEQFKKDHAEWEKTKQGKEPFHLDYSLEFSVLNMYLEGGSFAGFTTYPKDRPKWIKDMRFVFWFDN